MSAKEKSARLRDFAVTTGELLYLDPTVIEVEPGFNQRNFDDPAVQQHIKQLAESIREVGVQQPLTVRLEDGKVYLEDGECRLRACMLAIAEGAEIKSVPAKAGARHANEADRLLSQVLRNTGKPFTPVEQSAVFAKLTGLGWSEEDISKKIGLTVQQVKNILTVNQLPATARTMIQKGEVSATLAVRTFRENQENGAATVAVLKDAKTVAEATGKKKVTPKSVKKAKTKNGSGAAEEKANPDDATVKLMVSPRELAAVIAGLRMLQGPIERNSVPVKIDSYLRIGSVRPITTTGIDRLVERIAPEE